MVSFRKAGSNLERTRVTYAATRINVDLPLPDTASDIMFSGNRPYLRCVTSRIIETTRDDVMNKLSAAGWSSLTAADIGERWPGAKIEDAPENGVRAYFVNAGLAYQKPIMMTLQPRNNGASVEIKVAPFAQPQHLEAGTENYGLLAPKSVSHAAYFDGAARRELKATLAAELGPVLAFYRRELPRRGWTELVKDAAIAPDAATLTFTSADATGTLRLARQYDLTTIGFVVQVSDAALAAREKAKRDNSAKFIRDAEATAQAAIAASDTQRSAAAAGSPNADATLRPLNGNTAPVPLPDTAENIKFDGASGHLEFTSSSSIKALAAFHRATMKPLGWNETPAAIKFVNDMVVLEFAKARQIVSFTIMPFASKTRVSVDGSGLKVATAASAPANMELEADSDAPLPVPKQHTLSAPGAWSHPGGSPFRRELDASVPANLAAVLAFYRRELAKRDWKEVQGAVIRPESALLTFASPDGPAVLKLTRNNSETSVSLAQRNPDAAAKAGILPKRGQARLMLGNIGDVDAFVTIDGKTTKIAPGVGSPKTPNGPTVELAPGRYKVAVKVTGQADRSSMLSVAAGDSWGVMITPGGLLPLQLY